MKNTKFKYIHNTIKQRRKNNSMSFEDSDFPMTSGRKKFLDMLERMKQESLETGNRWEGPH